MERQSTAGAALRYVTTLAAVLLFIWLVLAKVLVRLGLIALPCPASFAGVLRNPWRRRYISPVLDWIGIQEDEQVLELGSGIGVFTLDAARRAGPDGRIIAVDVQPGMVLRLRRRLQRAGLLNVDTHIAGAYHLPLNDASIDRAFLVAVLGEIGDRRRALAELHRVLKPGGVLSITEEFPDPHYRFPFETTREVEEAGFYQCGSRGNLLRYTINFRKEVPA